MGKQLVWQERFNIGVDIIDREHRKLFSILNRMLRTDEDEEKNIWAYQEGIKYFKEHAMKHFTEEESYMASINYIGFETHRRLHDNFRRKTLRALEKELKQTNYSEEAISHFLSVCAGWLIGHTLIEDRAITGHGVSKWKDLLPEEEQAAMRQTIIQLLYDLFQLDAKVVSECYGGERFGQGIYYRLVYGTKQGEKWEIFLVFEEKLIVNTIGSMLPIESETINVMMVNAARYTARQFVERIRECFPSADLYEMKEENLLTYEQFQRAFVGQNPQFSLLFNTGEGYFAYCVVAPHLIENGLGTAIKDENAMAEVRKYLNKHKENLKKKLLVVDDSETMCQALKKLFHKDYEVSLTKSGLSAIASIALDRPDLVLLDYEMPVCDGSQVLAMIRSEKDFADIPVIFLTGRVDKESIQKVLALKPEGYLVKSLPPEEIKKEIDKYFKQKAAKEPE